MRDSSEFHRDLSTGRGIFDSREGFSSLSLSQGSVTVIVFIGSVGGYAEL